MDGYRERLIEEYTQVSERLTALNNTISKALEGTLPYKLNCPLEIMITQYFAMQTYLSVLEMRLKLDAAANADIEEPKEEAE